MLTVTSAGREERRQRAREMELLAAGRPTPPDRPSPAGGPGLTVRERLQELQRLEAEGFIDADAAARKREQLIAEL